MSRHKTCGMVTGENCSQASMLLLNLDKAMKDMEAQLELDNKSLREMDKNLAHMKLEADRLKRQINTEEQFIEAMGAQGDLGKAMREFEGFMGDVKRTYGEVRGKHKGNIDILKKEFNYHPAYKRGQDPNEFTGVYHTMHPHPDKMQVP